MARTGFSCTIDMRRELGAWGIQGGICWRLEQVQNGSLEGNPQLTADLADGPAGRFLAALTYFGIIGSALPGEEK